MCLARCCMRLSTCEHKHSDSFHGTAFSINFNKDFYVYANAHRGNSRFDSLLGLVGLQDRMIQTAVSAEGHIDWDSVNEKLEAERRLSREWLASQLKGKNE